MNIDRLAERETRERTQTLDQLQSEQFRYVEKPHATRVVPVEPEVIKNLAEQEQRDRAARLQMGVPLPVEPGVETPPSIYTEVHGKTILAETLKVLDDANTVAIHNYICHKMRVGNLEDTRENYDRVLHTLLSKNRINLNQRPAYVIQRLGLYLNGRLDEEDSLVMSILTKKGVRLYAR